MIPPYRAAIIGCGRIGSLVADSRDAIGVYSHAEGYAACPDTELVAVGDLDRERASLCAKRWQVEQVFADADDLFDAVKPEIVSICTPNETHFDIGMAALKVPGLKAILMEKPIALDLDQARRLAEHAHRQGVVLAVNYSRRYSEGFQVLRRKLKEGLVGRVQTVSGFYTKGVIHNGTHWFDLARLLLGEIKRVWGYGESTIPDPNMDARIEFASGATGYLHACDAESYTIFEMDIVGTHGRVRIVDLGHEVEIFKVHESARSPGYLELARVEASNPSLRDLTLHAIADLSACLRDPGRPPLCSAEDGIRALEIALAVRKSAESGEPVDVVLHPS